ncbi:zinc finger HIT domain-containing protein 3-like isoform X3 [Carya illinoinensis]|uniref:zinc finger HIT domain-containing protein 3-like isoform X3 n=1 Tax=Carya illinoinensis TaxID=32201 RepID=UPI001C71E6E2|nr:zinc finger HIT domain-containing protein 3-like isoform X3 [Carya illinoinensis]
MSSLQGSTIKIQVSLMSSTLFFFLDFPGFSCSVVCFKKHKEIPCAKPVSSEALDPESHVERPLNVEEPDDVLQKLQLEAIASSGEIRDALKDENLQKIIRNIDCSPDAENELEKAMGVEAFCMFTDKLFSDSIHHQPVAPTSYN